MHFEVMIGNSEEVEIIDADTVNDMPPFLIYTKNGAEVYRANASYVKKSKAVFSSPETE